MNAVRYTLHLLFFSLLTTQTIGQTINGSIDSPGDIAFVGFQYTSVDGYSFVFIDDCPPGTVIIFDDEEWAGLPTGWNSTSGEGANTWTNNTGNIISAGTVVTIESANNNPTATTGSVTESDSGFNLGGDDQIFAYIGTFRTNSVTFLAMIGDPDNPSPQTLNDTGLSLGTHVFDIDVLGGTNGIIYTGSTICNGTALECIEMINSSANWTIIGGGATFPDDVPAAFTGSALPVELIHFSGKSVAKNIELSWQTATEINNKNFTLERSADGRNFNEIAKVDGRGTSALINNYAFTDQSANAGVNYYRLSQTDFDGTQEYLATIAVEIDISEQVISVNPNPFNHQLQITLANHQSNNTRLDIYDASGSLKLSRIITGDESTLNINTMDWPSGFYFLRLIDAKEIRSLQIVKAIE